MAGDRGGGDGGELGEMGERADLGVGKVEDAWGEVAGDGDVLRADGLVRHVVHGEVANPARDAEQQPVRPERDCVGDRVGDRVGVAATRMGDSVLRGVRG